MPAEKVFKILENKKLTVAVVESMTAGYLSYLLTKSPGSSNTFKGSFLAYSLSAKNKLFKIPMPVLKKTQGVSKEIAAYLAEKIKNKLKSNIGISIVGFAGPATKKGIKTGTAFIGISDQKGLLVTEANIEGKRDEVRRETAKLTIEILCDRLKIL